MSVLYTIHTHSIAVWVDHNILQVFGMYILCYSYTHSYTVVESYDQFWVMESSPDKLLGRPPGDVMYIKLHGEPAISCFWHVQLKKAIIIANMPAIELVLSHSL